uniref:F-box domain-containing protein n=1 Tax=Tanacetum cinerariifolium TaxID=118510 RepID=A0A6L2MHC0_TANCI|nr:hypothetical protein [Tanacetum cinerariifolium]
MNKSERRESSNLENGVDFISNMPDLVLQLILHGLPNTEEVVRTTVLSTRWRYLWTSIPLFPSLNIDCDRLRIPSMTHPRAKKLQDFVFWALANKTVDLDSFRLCCVGYFDISTVWQWIDAAMMCKVKKLDLMFSSRDREVCIMLPHCLVTCESLESLRLYLYRSRVTFLDCKGFSALKVLELNHANYYQTDLMEKCLKMSPMLEKLSLIDCVIHIDDVLCIPCPKLKTLMILDCGTSAYSSFNVVVSCPQLVFFKCVGLQVDPVTILKTCPLLEELCLINCIEIDHESLKAAMILPKCRFHKESFCKILARISHVESLSLDCSFIRYACDLKGDLPKFFSNLKTLELTTTFENYDMKLFIRILTCSPNLASIHLIIQEVCSQSEYLESDRVQTMRILSPYLRRVEFLGFERDDKWKLDIARLLLEHGNALEKMVFSWCNQVDYHEKSMEALNDVSKFHKASSSVELVTLLKK